MCAYPTKSTLTPVSGHLREDIHALVLINYVLLIVVASAVVFKL